MHLPARESAPRDRETETNASLSVPRFSPFVRVLFQLASVRFFFNSRDGPLTDPCKL